MIQGYPSLPSVFPGDTLHLHISTDAPQFRVDFYRQGQALDFLKSSHWLTGQNFPPGISDVDWGWPKYHFSIPSNWRSGVYIAILIEGDGRGNARTDSPAISDARSARALFVVKSATPGQTARILYKLPLFTYQAYNEPSPNASFYDGSSKVTLRRPGGGNGASPWDTVTDVYDATSPRQTFVHWDAVFIMWLEKNGYVIDYCTDLDVHENVANFLSSYRLLLSVGHDEYWSEEERTNVETFIQDGGNVAFFSANACWWRVHVVDSNTAIVCDKSVHSGDNIPFDQWLRFNAETKLTGVSYQHAGGWWQGSRDALGYKVQHADHWLYNGTGVADGDVFGADERLVGYECDGALHSDFLGTKIANQSDGTPYDFLILGFAPLGSGWEDRFDGANAAATMGLHARNGIVFTAATVDWPRVLADGQPVVEAITRNILDCLIYKPIPIAGPYPAVCGMLAAVENTSALFCANTQNLSPGTDLHYQWRISNQTAPLPGDSATINIPIPAGPKAVTITVSVSEAGNQVGFGTLTFTPLTEQHIERVELRCRVISLIRFIERHYHARIAAPENSQTFADPLFDPLRGRVIHPSQLEGLRIAPDHLQTILQQERALLAITQRIIQHNPEAKKRDIGESNR